MDTAAIVYVVDDDPSIQSLVEATVRGMGAEVLSFSSAEEFARFEMPKRVSCVLLDVQMPGLSGLELLETHLRTIEHPVIMLTGHGSVSTAVKSLKLGAADFVEKPFERPVLVKAIQSALDADRSRMANAVGREEVRRRMEKLSKREAELLGAVVEGKSTKMIADQLGISARTVDHHRANLMAKMKAANVADLVRMAVEADQSRKPEASKG